MDALSVRLQERGVHQAESVVPTRTVVLHLRPAPTAEELELAQRHQHMHVTWDPDVREPVNQHVSKCCCIFHKKKLFGESSSESSSSSTDSSDDDNNNEVDHNGAGAGAGAPGAGGSDMGCVGHQGVCVHGDQAHHQHAPRKHRPKCTKDHCYCGTRFH